METNVDEIASLHRQWRDALMDEDVDRVVGFLTPDYELWAPGAEPIRGRENVRTMMTAALARYRIDPAFESEECLVSGDLAVDRGWDVQTVVPREGGVSQTRRQRVFLVIRRESDGAWRYARGMSQPGPAT
jgi:uncharacterized protein (TIGR02246 family)